MSFWAVTEQRTGGCSCGGEVSIKKLFDRFSWRQEDEATQPDVPLEFRMRVVMLCDRFVDPNPFDYGGHAPVPFWSDAAEKLGFRHPQNLDQIRAGKKGVVSFLLGVEAEIFLDFLEDIFQIDITRQFGREQVVEDLNQLLDLDDLPYQLTPYRETTSPLEVADGESLVGAYESHKTGVVYPKVIMRESEIVHAEAVAPALILLQDEGFELAEEEFHEALAHYRQGEFKDAASKSGTALESVLKVVCDQNGWAYSDKDTASKLIDTLVDQSGLDGFFKQGLQLGTQIRNSKTLVHGQGTTKKEAPKHLAQFVLNLTASVMLFVVAESRKK